METLFFSAFAIAISFAIQPGVIGFESLRRGISHGWTAALHVELGSLVGDATWAAIALLGASILFQNAIITLLMSFFGCFLLLRFAWEAWKAAQSDVDFEAGKTEGNNHFMAGAVLSLSNPQNLTGWLGMSGTIIGLGFLNPQPVHLAVFFAGFMIAQVIWCFFFATVVEYGRRMLTQRIYRWINLTCAVFLTYLSVTLMIQTIQFVLA